MYRALKRAKGSVRIKGVEFRDNVRKSFPWPKGQGKLPVITTGPY